ncbi:uncharacterized protein BJX67DRAFT_229729 [Aspergillus lucknowensis]|uniref:RING-type domain-containing protein n=1 Tax=Aspergillus lucknowensis TaxID=176173 RepID=A0ABR4LKT7_9EURO
MIWPEEYRPALFDTSEFVCPPCLSGRETSAEVTTSARELGNENTLLWLAQDLDQPGISPLTNRSIFHTVSTMGTDGFLRRITLFPAFDKPLTHRGRPIRNADAILSKLKDLVSGRQATKVNCSLCFSSSWPSALNSACGRPGCLQRICSECSGAWYRSNTSGSIINTAALGCPFCRRLPSPRTIAKHGNGIHAVKDLNRAIENRSQWIYAWCSVYSSAKEYVERDCARRTAPQLTD